MTAPPPHMYHCYIHACILPPHSSFSSCRLLRGAKFSGCACPQNSQMSHQLNAGQQLHGGTVAVRLPFPCSCRYPRAAAWAPCDGHSRPGPSGTPFTHQVTLQCSPHTHFHHTLSLVTVISVSLLIGRKRASLCWLFAHSGSALQTGQQRCRTLEPVK